jgi:hypothetical protein
MIENDDESCDPAQAIKHKEPAVLGGRGGSIGVSNVFIGHGHGEPQGVKHARPDVQAGTGESRNAPTKSPGPAPVRVNVTPGYGEVSL